MGAKGVGERAARLDWLWPNAESLHALTRPLSLTSWQILRFDPAALLLLAGCELTSSGSPPLFRFSQFRAIHSLRKTSQAFNNSEDESKWIDWQPPTNQLLLQSAIRIARYAETIANYTRKSDRIASWIGGLLAPLGWFAVAAVSPDSVQECLDDPDYRHAPLEAEGELWNSNHAEIARRVSRRMHLPNWLQVIVGHIDLNLESAHALGADLHLFSTIRLAMDLAAKEESPLRLTTHCHRHEDLQNLDLVAEDLLAIEGRFRENDSLFDSTRTWQHPGQVSLLPELIEACLGDRLLTGPHTESIESEVDRLHQRLSEQERTEAYRLEDDRLSSLAEFAAGAAHEINNPLAVISGHSQYLLKAENDEKRRDSLQSIVRQVGRIHGILTDVMQFARPSTPVKKSASLHEQLQAVIHQLRPVSQSRKVEIQFPESGEEPISISMDAKQVQTILAALIRNAVEATPPQGWVRVAVKSTTWHIEVTVEDSGPGMTEEQLKHAFDPFFCGRSAGRGRGFGLPIAWRLARENGGEVRFEPEAEGITRFVFRLPFSEAEASCSRLSA